VVRDGELRNYAHPSVQRLAAGDKVVCIADVDRQMDGGSGPNGAVDSEER
jgi:hypothetical protein